MSEDMAGGRVEHGRIDYLDGWRGLAIALVLQSHFLPVPGFAKSGYLGVDMFFYLSGLLMSKLLFVKRTPLLTFYERRINRILPAFFLFVTTIFTLAAFTDKAASASEYGFTLTFLRTYFPSQPNLWSTPLPIGHLWSLNVEEHSYIFMSLLTLVAALKRHEGLTLIGVGIVAMLTHVYYGMNPDIAPTAYFSRTECAMSFIMISAGYSLLKHKISPYVKPSMPIVALMLAALCYADWFPVRGGTALICPVLLSFTVNHLSEASNALIQLLRVRGLRLLGAWSYSIYLWQQPFFVYKSYFPPGIALILAIMVGLVSFYFYENPLRIWLNERKYLDWRLVARLSP